MDKSSVLRIAFNDIHQYIIEENNLPVKNIRTSFYKFIVTKLHVDTRETHLLNEQLKIRGLNMFNNINRIKNTN